MTVIVYSTPRCPQCNATKRQLDRMGVPYRQIDVTVDTEASAMLRAAGYRQAPVVMAGDRVWTGYRPDLLRTLAERHDQESHAASHMAAAVAA